VKRGKKRAAAGGSSASSGGAAGGIRAAGGVIAGISVGDFGDVDEGGLTNALVCARGGWGGMLYRIKGEGGGGEEGGLQVDVVKRWKGGVAATCVNPHWEGEVAWMSPVGKVMRCRVCGLGFR